jgi:hypothetical protein
MTGIGHHGDPALSNCSSVIFASGASARRTRYAKANVSSANSSAVFQNREIPAFSVRDSRKSPLSIHAPSKTREIFARVVRIKIDVETRNAIATKLEDIAEAPAGSDAARPRFS